MPARSGGTRPAAPVTEPLRSEIHFHGVVFRAVQLYPVLNDPYDDGVAYVSRECHSFCIGFLFYSLHMVTGCMSALMHSATTSCKNVRLKLKLGLQVGFRFGD